ncbi:uncharacterized protein BJX67DRAFT_368732 [Aspergillus lucknowensis]|uniref:Uncharacterized protein n=1 Tax=Aspergillus lucknowensis TaxID=176173 RepID=A0ABR4L5R8_9EURO
MDIISALRALRNASTEVLQSHHQEILQTLSDVGQRLNPNFLLDDHRSECISIPSRYSASEPDDPDQSCYQQSSDSENSNEGSHTPLSVTCRLEESEKNSRPEDCATIDEGRCRKSEARPSSVWPAKLLEASAGTLDWLYKFSRTDPADAIRARRSRGKDYRIEDIQRVDGRKKPGKEDQLFKGFAQRSLGCGYISFQRGSGGNTRVDELCEGICCSKPELIKKKQKSITQYCESLGLKPDDKETLLRAINAGVKQLVTEKLFGKRLEESGRPNMPGAISAFTALNMHAFSRLRFEDIPSFIDLIVPHIPQAEARIIEPPTGSDGSEYSHVADSLISLSVWFMDFQSAYDANISTTQSEVGEPPLKRQRLINQSSSNPETIPGHTSTPGIGLPVLNAYAHLQPDPGLRQGPILSSSEQDSRERPITSSSSFTQLCYDEDNLANFLMGFTDLNLPDCELEGFQRMFYQPVQNGSSNFGW